MRLYVTFGLNLLFEIVVTNIKKKNNNYKILHYYLSNTFFAALRI